MHRERKAGRRYVDLVEELASRTEKTLARLGYRQVRVETPQDVFERSIDIIAWSPEDAEKRIHVKVTLDLSALSNQEISDMLSFSKTLGSKPVIVSEYDRRIDMHDDVVYEKNTIPAVNSNTLEGLLGGDPSLFIVGKRGDFYVRIDGEKLRLRRLEKNLSLGEISEVLGVSRKAVYEYERGSFDVSVEVAERLLELFGDDITKPYDLFEEEVGSHETRTPRPDNRLEDRIMKVLSTLGLSVYHAKKTFVDVLGKGEDAHVLVSVEHTRSKASIEEKLSQLEKLRHFREVRRIVVVEHAGKNVSPDDEDIVVYRGDEVEKGLRKTLEDH